jgi:hypothetical protein
MMNHQQVIWNEGNYSMTSQSAIGIPERSEAGEYYFTYINRITSGDILGVLESQIEPTVAFLRGISEEKSLHRYAPDKWSIRQTWNHVNDAERLFAGRALWFARGLEGELPSFDQNVAVASAHADSIAWARHIEEFRHIRMASIDLFQSLPAEAWKRTGVASGNPFSVRAVAYVVAGHVDHHLALLRDRYL